MGHHSSIPNDALDDIAPEGGQCGGADWDGATICPAGSFCIVQNKSHSKCVPAPTAARKADPQMPAYVSSSSCGGGDALLQEVFATQNAWGDALVSISTTYETQGLAAATALAEKIIDAAYGYNYGPVLFKPTLTSGNQTQTFRPTREGALSYFVGGNPAFPNDTGFALKGWTKVDFDNNAIYLDCDIAMAMGNVHITNKDGSVTTVDKSFGYRRGEDGNLRIILHHSSLPNEILEVA